MMVDVPEPLGCPLCSGELEAEPATFGVSDITCRACGRRFYATADGAGMWPITLHPVEVDEP